MLATPVEIVGHARVTFDAEEQVGTASYEFQNGFDGGTPDGATAGAAAIEVVAPGHFILFLDAPEYSGLLGSDGGLSAYVTATNVGQTPVVGWGTVEIAPTLAGDYAGVDPMKAIGVRIYGVPNDAAEGPQLIATDLEFSIIVFRNPVTVIG